MESNLVIDVSSGDEHDIFRVSIYNPEDPERVLYINRYVPQIFTIMSGSVISEGYSFPQDAGSMQLESREHALIRNFADCMSLKEVKSRVDNLTPGEKEGLSRLLDIERKNDVERQARFDEATEDYYTDRYIDN